MSPTQLADSSTVSSPEQPKVDPSTIYKFAASSWTFRIAWAPVQTTTDPSTVRYDVEFVGEQTGEQHTCRTPNNVPSIELPTRLFRGKVGDTFIIQIRVLNITTTSRTYGVGEWSETSSAFSVARPSPSSMMAEKRPPPSPPESEESSPPSPRDQVLEALPYAATRRAQAKNYANDAKRSKCQGSFFQRLVSGFRRPAAKA